MNLRSSIIFLGIVLVLIIGLGFLTGIPEAIAPGINAALILAIPLLAGIYLIKRYNLTWRLFWIGAAVFTLSQVLHIPYNSYILDAFITSLGWELAAGSMQLFLVLLLYGLSSGVFEETARYLMYRFWVKDSRSWKDGVMLGAGHGGIEVVFVGLVVIATLYQMIAVKDTSLVGLVEPDNLVAAEEYVTGYWAAPAWSHFLALFERLFTFILHISLSLLVLQVFRRKNIGWLAAAIIFHTLVNVVALFIAQSYGVVYSEIAMFLFALLSIYIIIWLRNQEPPEEIVYIEPVEMLDLQPAENPPDQEIIEKTRYD